MPQDKKTEVEIIEWAAPEFEYYQKSKSWFIVGGSIAALILLWALWSNNILFALVIGLAYFSLAVFAMKKPRQLQLSVDFRGVRIDNLLYSYDDLKSFWIFYNPPFTKELSLRSRKKLMPYVKIPLGDESPVEIRKILLKYLPERKHKESAVDNLAKMVGF